MTNRAVIPQNFLFALACKAGKAKESLCGMTALLLVTLICAFPAYTAETLADPHEESRAVTLGEELRCVVCQSESINDSQADMARDMRLLVREKIHQGWTDEQILHFAQSRYGDFILLKPPVQPNTYILWALPILFLAGAGGIIRGLLKRQKRAKNP